MCPGGAVGSRRARVRRSGRSLVHGRSIVVIEVDDLITIRIDRRCEPEEGSRRRGIELQGVPNEATRKDR